MGSAPSALVFNSRLFAFIRDSLLTIRLHFRGTDALNTCPVGGRGAIDRAAREQRGQFRNRQAAKLVFENGVHPSLTVGHLVFGWQTLAETPPCGDRGSGAKPARGMKCRFASAAGGVPIAAFLCAKSGP